MATVVGVRIRNNRGPFVEVGQAGNTEKFPERLEHKLPAEGAAVVLSSTGSNPVRALHFSILQYNTCNLYLQANLLCITD